MSFIRRFVTGAALSIVLFAASGAGAAPVQAAGLNRLVDDDGVQCPTRTDSNITSAKDAIISAGGSGTITVCAGVYQEQVQISSSNVKLIGKPGARIVAPASLSGAVVQVFNSTNVTVQGFIVDGGNNFAGPIIQGITYTQSTGTISKNHITGIRGNTPGVGGLGIVVHQAPGTVKILNNTIFDFDGDGIYIFKSPNPIIQRNLLLPTPAGTGHRYGIYVYRSEGGTISANSITCDWFPGTISDTVGIRLEETPNLKIANNQVANFQTGIFASTQHVMFSSDGMKITGNRFYNTNAGINIDAVATTQTVGGDATANSVQITGNKFFAPSFESIEAIILGVSHAGGSFSESVANTLVKKNQMYGHSGWLLETGSTGTVFDASNKIIQPPVGF